MNIFYRACGICSTNTYIVYNNPSHAILIDPADFMTIQQYAREHKINFDAVLLTHGHFDHIWDLPSIRSYYKNAEVYIHKADAELLSDNVKNGYSAFGGDSGRYFGDYDKLVSDRDTLEFADMSVNVIHTPGHTKGSVAYVIENNIFSGDTLFKENIGRCDLYGGDFGDIRRSVKSLIELGDYTVYPGHGEVTDTFHEKEYNIYYSKSDLPKQA